MATLYDYLASLDVDGNPLIWSFRPLEKSEIDAANGKPYARVEELEERPLDELYGNQNVIEGMIDVMIYQAPTGARMPSRSEAMQLYFDLYDAPKHVDEHIYGQPLIALHLDLALPPVYDEDSGGLAGMIRFRLLFPRG